MPDEDFGFDEAVRDEREKLVRDALDMPSQDTLDALVERTAMTDRHHGLEDDARYARPSFARGREGVDDATAALGVLEGLAGMLDEKSAAALTKIATLDGKVDLLEHVRDRLLARDDALIAAMAAANFSTLPPALQVAWFVEYVGANPARVVGKSASGVFSRADAPARVDGMQGVLVGRQSAPLLPALLPELRAHLRRLWDDGMPFAAIAPQIGSGLAPGDRSADRIVAWEREALDRASLWWVSAEMVEVLLAAAQSLPDDVHGRDVVPLDRFGLVALERPWAGVSATPGQAQVKVDAFVWGPTTLSILEDRPDIWTDRGIEAVSLSSYSCFPPGEELPRDLRSMTLNGLLWAPLGRSDWPLADRLDREAWPMPEQSRESFAEDRKVLCALMTLLAHEGIAQHRISYPPRPVRRRLDRAHGERDHAFRIVTLRTLREPNDMLDAEADETRVHHDHRWITSGHWRNQPYGPKRSLRRLQWISPYVSGPEGAPLRVRETIHAWRR